MEAESGLNDGIQKVEFRVSRGEVEGRWRMFEGSVDRVRVVWMKFRELSGVLCGRKLSVKMKGGCMKHL